MHILLGAYVTEKWEMSRSHEFYGTGECFVFKFTTSASLDKSVQDEQEIQLFRWTKANSFFMNSSSSHLGIGGGGGGFAISLDSDLNQGTSNQCQTFGNSGPLCKGDGNFQVLSLEVFGFESSTGVKSRFETRKARSDTELFGSA